MRIPIVRAKYRIEPWPVQTSILHKTPEVQFNPQYYDEKKKKWRPYTRVINGIMKPVLYPTRFEANHYIKVMKVKDKRSKTGYSNDSSI